MEGVQPVQNRSQPVFIDRLGLIVYKYIGPIVGPTYTHLTENIIRPLLQEKPSTIL